MYCCLFYQKRTAVISIVIFPAADIYSRDECLYLNVVELYLSTYSIDPHFQYLPSSGNKAFCAVKTGILLSGVKIRYRCTSAPLWCRNIIIIYQKTLYLFCIGGVLCPAGMFYSLRSQVFFKSLLCPFGANCFYLTLIDKFLILPITSFFLFINFKEY